ncbi:MAG: T9SS type A sorting domain-containing protein [Flavobacteriales bacterium]|nr:T9SS type A sorting domain-containing protein [Flavobacteriales bacterium]
MKKLMTTFVLILLFCQAKAVIHTVYVWDGYFQFTPSAITIDLGDTIQWLPLGGGAPSMAHTITSSSIPATAASFDYTWQAPADTFFQYVPTVAGIYDYVCTPHATMNMVGQFTVNNAGTSVADDYPKPDELRVYPNPTCHTIFLLNDENSYSFKLYSTAGKMVSEGIFNTQLDLSYLPNGIYILELIGEQRKRIMVSKQ